MRPATPLTSLDNPRIKEIVHLRKHRRRRESGLFVAEGSREISRALRANLCMLELFYCRQMLGQPIDAVIAGDNPTAADARRFEVSVALLTKMSYLENPEGLIAIFRQPEYTLDMLPPAGTSDLFLIADDINKPGNLGAMARTAAAAGCIALLATDAEIDAFNPNAIRASTGAVFTLPIIQIDAEEAVAFLRARGVNMFAATPDANQPIDEVDLGGPTAIVIGAEDRGISEIWRREASGVAIPMAGGQIDSLNASNAAAIMLFEALRQRRRR